MTRLRELLDRGRRGALVSWALVGVLALAAGKDLLDGDLLWAGFALVAGVIAIVPSLVYRDPAITLTWPVLTLAVLPIVARTLGSAQPLIEVATHVSVAGLALLVAVEIDAFSPVRLPATLGVVFVVLTTMAAAGTWAVVEWFSDQFLGTSFIVGRGELMWDLVGATAVGVIAGVVFELYFREEGDEGEGETRFPSSELPNRAQ